MYNVDVCLGGVVRGCRPQISSRFSSSVCGIVLTAPGIFVLVRNSRRPEEKWGRICCEIVKIGVAPMFFPVKQ